MDEMERDLRRNGALIKAGARIRQLGWNSTCFIEDLSQELRVLYSTDEIQHLDTEIPRFINI